MSAPVIEAARRAASARETSLWADTRRNILRQRVAQVRLLLLGLLIAIAVVAPVIATHDPYDPVGVDEGLLHTNRARPS